MRNYPVGNGDRDITKPLYERVSLKTPYTISLIFLFFGFYVGRKHPKTIFLRIYIPATGALVSAARGMHVPRKGKPLTSTSCAQMIPKNKVTSDLGCALISAQLPIFPARRIRGRAIKYEKYIFRPKKIRRQT